MPSPSLARPRPRRPPWCLTCHDTRRRSGVGWSQAEGIALARSQGVSDDLLRAWFADAIVVSQADRLRLEAVLDENHPGWFTPQLARKDLELAIGLARLSGLPIRMAPAAAEQIDRAIDRNPDWQDVAAVIEALG